MSSSMTTNDRETLSALFDGELEDDAARFALRRLDHDAGWRDACSRWQLAGDVLRGQAVGLAPAGFAERVATAMATERADVATIAVASGEARSGLAPANAQVQSRRWWGRAALAASVAVAALFVTHPFSGVGPDDSTTGNPMAAIPAPSASTLADSASSDTGAQPSSPSGGAEVAAIAVAAADVPRRVTERRARGGAAAGKAVSRREVEAPVTVALAASDPGSRPVAPTATDPFKPQPGELVARPWPRAVLPGSTVAGALTASYGASQASPSFYPFEPDAAHLPANVEPAPQP